jgi:hypothetical protein
MINQTQKHPLRALNGREYHGGNQVMKRKRAIVILDLADESITDRNDNIAQELFSWFREDAFSVPWAKDVKGVTVKTGKGSLETQKTHQNVADRSKYQE